MKVPFLDLKREYQSLKKDIDRAVFDVFEKGEYCFGSETEKLENLFARFTESKYCFGVSSGTDSLIIALKALGVGEGDEVITTPLTFVATAEAIVHVGARPVFVDIEEDTMNLDVQKLTSVISKKTKAIIPVHLYGVCVEMDKLLSVAKKFKLLVAEDASHAIGSLYKGRSAGSWGDIGCFSLYPTKTLGAYGNAGIMVTNQKSLAEKIKRISNHGRGADKNLHEEIGYTGTIDNIQAAILNVKMKLLIKNIKGRKAIAYKYNQAFKNFSFKLQVSPEGCDSCPYVYTIRTEKRETLKNYLDQQGIGTGIYYPLPLHLQPSLKFLGYKEGDFPMAEKTALSVLSLPLFPEMSDEEVGLVIKEVRQYYTGIRSKGE